MKLSPILLLIIICIFPSFVFSGSSRKTLPYEKIFLEVREKAAIHLAKKYKMRLCGVSEGVMYNINLMGLSFEINRKISKNDTRVLLVNCANDFLKIINENEEIRPYLKIYPFDTKHIEVVIFAGPLNTGTVYHPDLVVGSVRNGEIKYCTNDSEHKYKYKVCEYEPFEDSVKIVNGEMPAPPSEIN